MKVSIHKIERRMAELAMTQTDLSARMGVTPASLHYSLNSAKEGRELKPATAANIARGLECTIDDLLAAPARRKPLPSPASSRRHAA